MKGKGGLSKIQKDRLVSPNMSFDASSFDTFLERLTLEHQSILQHHYASKVAQFFHYADDIAGTQGEQITGPKPHRKTGKK